MNDSVTEKALLSNYKECFPGGEVGLSILLGIMREGKTFPHREFWGMRQEGAWWIVFLQSARQDKANCFSVSQGRRLSKV